MQMFELSITAEQLFMRACAISTHFRHDFVEPEHFLLGMVTALHDSASRLLASYGITNDTVRPLIEQMHVQYPQGQARVIEPLSQESIRLIDAAIIMAQLHRPGTVATPMYILVVLIKSQHPTILQIFDALAVNPDRVALEAVRSIMSSVN